MDHIEQLKKIRTDAITRLRASPDFKLAGKLGLLIVELGDTVDDAVDFEEPDETTADALVASKAEGPKIFESSFAKPESDEFTDLTSDKMIDDLVAEIEGDAAELDALMAEQSENDDESHDDSEDKVIGPFIKPDVADRPYTNGATH